MLREAAERGLSSLKFLEVIVEAFTERSELNLTEMRALLCSIACFYDQSADSKYRILSWRGCFPYELFVSATVCFSMSSKWPYRIANRTASLTR